MKIDLRKLPEEETFEIVRDILPDLLEEHLWALLDDLAEQLDADEIVAHLEARKEQRKEPRE
jgi:hypothetical protein